MTVELGYALRFVADMGHAVWFYGGSLGPTPDFASPDWAEFATGGTMLASHPPVARGA